MTYFLESGQSKCESCAFYVSNGQYVDGICLNKQIPIMYVNGQLSVEENLRLKNYEPADVALEVKQGECYKNISDFISTIPLPFQHLIRNRFDIFDSLRRKNIGWKSGELRCKNSPSVEVELELTEPEFLTLIKLAGPKRGFANFFHYAISHMSGVELQLAEGGRLIAETPDGKITPFEQ